MCACVRVRVRARACMCSVCVCVRACMRACEGKREGEGGQERDFHCCITSSSSIEFVAECMYSSTLICCHTVHVVCLLVGMIGTCTDISPVNSQPQAHAILVD